MTIIGVSLIALGIANAAAGWIKMDEYRDHKHEAVAAGGEPARLPFSGTPSILDPATDAQLLYELAAMKYDYYEVVRTGGFVFIAAGLAMLGALRVSRSLAARRTEH
ncbi:MAG TPA: hypothetical protein VGK20_08875 [Candidatus Binatia bacterium]